MGPLCQELGILNLLFYKPCSRTQYSAVTHCSGATHLNDTYVTDVTGLSVVADITVVTDGMDITDITYVPHLYQESSPRKHENNCKLHKIRHISPLYRVLQ